MAGNTITYNGTTITPTSVSYNGNSISEIILNGTSVWLKCYTAGNGTTLYNATLPDTGNTEAMTHLDTYTVTRCGTYNVVYFYQAIWKGVRSYIRINGSQVHSLADINGDVTTKTTATTYVTPALSTGDTISFYQEPFHPWSYAGGGNWQIKVN